MKIWSIQVEPKNVNIPYLLTNYEELEFNAMSHPPNKFTVQTILIRLNGKKLQRVLNGSLTQIT